jgi:hypothetical protein
MSKFHIGSWHGPYNIALRYRAGMWFRAEHLMLTLIELIQVKKKHEN